MRIVLTQPYVAAYRVPLLERIAELLAASGHEFMVAAGRPTGDQAARADDVHPPWLHDLDTRYATVGPWTIPRRTLPPELRGADVLVTELDVKNKFAWFRRSHGASMVVLWGHGKSYVAHPSRLGEWMKRTIARRADLVLTYTASGRDYLVSEMGISAPRVVAIGNATDTGPLIDGRDRAIADGVRESLLRELGNGPHFLFVGGLDSSKRISFLVDAARALRLASPESKLIVCGDGVDRATVEEAAARGDVRYLGPVSRARVGEVASACSAVWMPGRVGLIAIDALALDLPVHTTSWGGHAPEIEYLGPQDILYLPDDPAAFAKGSHRASAGHKRPRRATLAPTIDSVASAFVAAILEP